MLYKKKKTQKNQTLRKKGEEGHITLGKAFGKKKGTQRNFTEGKGFLPFSRRRGGWILVKFPGEKSFCKKGASL